MEKILVFLGITFQFLAFWLVAPQFIGKEGLKKMEVIFDKVIGKLPAFFIMIPCLYLGWKGNEEIQFTPFYISKLGIFLCVITLFFLIFNKKIERLLLKVVSKPLQNKLQNKDIMNKSFYLGAFFFILGYFLQVTSLFI